MTSTSAQLIKAAQELREGVRKLHFSPPVAYVYNPLEYAWDAHRMYLERYGDCRKKVVFLGMNPGPFGMVQTGVPFGEITAVREWMKIQTAIGKPTMEHPKRPVQGFDCVKSEVSGRRLWGLFAMRYPNADKFFANHMVINYCPLAFVEESGRNRTPDKLPASESKPLEEACALHLGAVLDILKPQSVVGIGQFAAKRVEALAPGRGYQVVCILHPSPANPSANRNWAETVESQLIRAGLWE